MSIENMIREMAKYARQASRELRRLGRAQKDAALELMAAKLVDRQADIVKEN